MTDLRNEKLEKRKKRVVHLNGRIPQARLVNQKVKRDPEVTRPCFYRGK